MNADIRFARQLAKRPACFSLCYALLFCTACSNNQTEDQTSSGQVVNVYSWSDYIAPETIPKCEAETGIKVNYDTYDSTYIVDSKLLAGRSGYDLITHAGQNSSRLIPLGIFTELDKNKLSHWDEQDPFIRQLSDAYPGTSSHSVIYSWGSTGIAYNIDLVRARLPDVKLDSLALLFDPALVSKLADCGVSMLDEADDVFPMALSYLGLDPNITGPRELQAVEDLFAGVRPYIRYFSSTKMISDLPNQEVCVAMSWSGDYAQAAARAKEVGFDIQLRYIFPKEGSRFWFDGMYIPSDARNKDNAYRLMDFIMRPENMAQITNHIYYANGITTSKPMLLPEVINDPGIYPDADNMKRMYIYRVRDLSEERLINRSWARIKSGL